MFEVKRSGGRDVRLGARARLAELSASAEAVGTSSDAPLWYHEICVI